MESNDYGRGKTLMSHEMFLRHWEMLKNIDAFKALFGTIRQYANTWEDEYSHKQMAVAVWHLIEDSANWDTTCVNCGTLMNKNYEMYNQLEQIRAILNNGPLAVESRQEGA
jgi:hypothetical protein